MALKVDDNPTDSRDDKLNPQHRVSSDGSHDNVNLRRSEQAAFDDRVRSAYKDPANAEQPDSISTDDGQDSAVNDKEQKAVKKTSEVGSWKNRVGQKKLGRFSGRKKMKIFFAALTVTIVLATAGTIFLLPGLAVKTVMAKSTEFFMDRINYATEQRVERYVNGYFGKMVRGSLDRCGTYISADCRQIDPGRGIAGNLYKNWREARIEERLSKKYGLSFEKETRGNNTVMVVYKTNAAGIKGKVGDFGENTVTRELTQLVQAESRSEEVRDRWLLRSLLAGKYGANKWCFIACEQQDELDRRRVDALTKAKLRIAARVVSPISAKQSAVIVCLLASCSDEDYNREIRNAAKEALDATDADLDEAIRAIENPDSETGIGSNRTIGQYYASKALEKLLVRFGVDRASQVAFSAVPVAGQIYLGATIADLYDRLDTAIEEKQLSQYASEIKAAAAVEYYAIMQSSSDAVFSGEAALADTGAISTILANSNQSRVWQQADGATNLSSVECEDGTVLSEPSDPLACPEKKITSTLAIEEWRQNSVVQDAEFIVNPYGNCVVPLLPNNLCPPGGKPKDVVRPILEGIDWFVGGVASFALGAISRLPVIGDWLEEAQAFVADKMAQLLGVITEKVFGVNINPDAEGQEAFDQMASGLDVAANDFAKGEETEDGAVIGLGASRLTQQQEVALAEAISSEKEQEIKQQSFFARYLDLNNPDSLAASSGLAVAQNVLGSQEKRPNISPINTVAGLFDNLVPTERAYANGLVNREAVFGVQQYGYAIDDPNFNIDPEELTPERCQEFAQLREETAEEDPETGELIYTRSNPCMLDEVVVSSLSKIYDLDDPSEFAGVTTPGGSGVVSADGYAFPLEPQTKAVSGIFQAHHDGTPAFDLFSVDSADVYAISDGVVDTVNTSFNGVDGCTSIQFSSVDGFWYWHGHLKNPTVQKGDVVKAGDKLAEVADDGFGSRCVGGGPHLHIDRGCVRGGVPQRGGTDSCRDPDFIPFLRSIWEGLPDG